MIGQKIAIHVFHLDFSGSIPFYIILIFTSGEGLLFATGLSSAHFTIVQLYGRKSILSHFVWNLTLEIILFLKMLTEDNFVCNQ